ncbi:hypothetical protein EXIGLDRAFT_622788, partial [Exidia glandulosa HHB12029]
MSVCSCAVGGRQFARNSGGPVPRTASAPTNVPFGVTYVKIGTIQRRLAWPLHKDDTLRQSG